MEPALLVVAMLDRILCSWLVVIAGWSFDGRSVDGGGGSICWVVDDSETRGL